jgi:GT2 family glycosyltransferase
MLLPRAQWELLVVDNNSGDGSVEMIESEFPEARLLANTENLGFARANNQACRQCRGEYILLLNPDTVVFDNAIDRMLETMNRRSDVAVLGCRLVNSDRSFQRWSGGHPPTLANIFCHFLFAYRLLPERMLPRPLYLESEPAGDVDIGWVCGACMLLRREALQDRLFDERFFLYGEDVDLCDRLARAGWKVMYTAAACVMHHEGRSLAAQTSQIQLSKLRSLRDIFAARHGGLSLRVYDVVVLTGFLLRSVAFAVAARRRPGQGFEVSAAKSRQYLAEAFRTLVHR